MWAAEVLTKVKRRVLYLKDPAYKQANLLLFEKSEAQNRKKEVSTMEKKVIDTAGEPERFEVCDARN